MKKTLIYIKFIGLIIIVIFLYAFAGNRNNNRKIEEVELEFVEEQNLYVSELAVNKLLIQNQVGVTNVGKEILVLNTIESVLDTHKMIEDSDVYITVYGGLRARIKQRTPIARVNAVIPFYIDSMGEMMPLSDNHSAHVPLISNLSEREVQEIFPLLKKIREDEFLKKHMVSIYRSTGGEYILGLRVYTFDVNFGKVEFLDNKIRNFKAFYQKALKDQSLDRYKKVSLQFSNQVVCTLK